MWTSITEIWIRNWNDTEVVINQEDHCVMDYWQMIIISSNTYLNKVDE